MQKNSSKNKNSQTHGRTNKIRLSSIIAIIVCVILLPIFVMNLTITIKSYVNPDKVPDFFGIKPFIVLSGSMEPAIFAGDLVISKTVDPASLKVNDVISFKQGNAVVTHRIVDIDQKDNETVFVTKGDANNVADQNTVSYAQVEGIQVIRIGKIGHLALFMQTPVGMLLFIGVPLCLFILYDVIRRKAADRNERKKDSEAQAEIDRLRAQLKLEQNNDQ